MTAAKARPANRDPFDRRLTQGASGLLARFNAAKVLEPVEVHAAVAVGRLVGESRPEALLAAALAVRGTRLGHVRIELGSVRDTVVVDDPDDPVASLPWPEPAAWQAALASSPLCGAGEPSRPLVLSGDCVYLQRYWDYEQRVAEDLRRRAAAPSLPADGYAGRLEALFAEGAQPGELDLQRLAAAMAVTQSLTVITGGPGTGKTTTVARLVAALLSAAEEKGEPPPAVALAAPTGKAADRITEKLHEEANKLLESGKVSTEVHERLGAIEGSTIHRLLGAGLRRGPFRHGPDNPLPHDLVVVDEMSMVDLPLAAKLFGAIRAEARLVLVGDHRQLVSIEAGSVLADVVGPGSEQLRLSKPARLRLEPLAGALPADPKAPGSRQFGDTVVPLLKDWRHAPGTGIPELIDAIREEPPNPDRVIEVLRQPWPALTWLETEETTPEALLATPQLAGVVDRARELIRLGEAGEVKAALACVRRLAVLCPYRQLPPGVGEWVTAIEHLAQVGPARWYPGRPVMVTANDYTLGLFNGDIGVTVIRDGRPVVFFPGVGDPERFGPARLEDIQTVHAMTIHKSQGSEYPQVVVLLPTAHSPLLTRELFYTAVSRVKVTEDKDKDDLGPGTAAGGPNPPVKAMLTVVGTAAAIQHAVRTQVRRASGLDRLLWGPKA